MGTVSRLTPSVLPAHTGQVSNAHQVWTCGCDGNTQLWFIDTLGRCVCSNCRCVSTVIKSVKC